MTTDEILTALWEARIYDKEEFFQIGQELLNPKDNTPIQKIESIVLKYYPGVTTKDLKSNTRKREISEVRQIIWYLCKKYYPNLSYTKIGGYYNKHHSTAMHGVGKITAFIESYKSVREEIELIEEEIKNL